MLYQCQTGKHIAEGIDSMAEPVSAPPDIPATDTGNGFLVGTDPKEPIRTMAEVQVEQLPPVSVTTTTTNGTPTTQPHFYTEDDLERVRREEKDKLYGRIQTMDEQLKQLQRERDEREAARQAELDRLADEARQKEESEMELRDLLNKRDEEWQNRMAEIEARYEQDRAVFERERRFQEVAAYRQARLDQEAEYIIPELRDLVRGNSETEVDESIEEMKARTAAIMGQLEQANQMQQRGMRGAAPTAPPVGPMEQMESYESLTPQDIASMDMETYKKFRGSLLEASARQYRGS